MDINITAKYVNISQYRGEILANLENIDIAEVINEIGVDNILNEIGKDAAFGHFGFDAVTFQELIERFNNE